MINAPRNSVKLLILIGPAGSGKTKIANSVFPGWVKASADDYFIKSNGDYVFERWDIQKAHDACYKKVVDAIGSGKNCIVDNTNTKINEFEKYLALNKVYPKLEIKIYKVTTLFKSTKDIPEYICQRHISEYEPHPLERKVHLNNDTKKTLIFV